MKQLLLILSSTFLTLFVCAQAPTQINYQGIARNSGGSPLSSQNITVRLSVHDGTASGIVLYQETRSLTTDRFGMFVIAIGSPGATNVVNSVSGIDWSVGGSKFLQVEISPNNNNNYVDMGSAQLLAVPYAFFANGAYPIGPATGDLTGTYPNPNIADGVVFTSKLADSSVTTVKIKDAAVTTSKIADQAITAAKIADRSITLSKFSIITAGGDLTGIYPFPTIAASAVTTLKIADSAVTTSKIKDSSITLAKLAPGISVGGGAASGAAGGDLSGTYPNPVIADSAVGTSKIANLSVTSGKIQDGAVTTSKIADRSITAAKLTAIAAGGDLTGIFPIPSIAANAVTTSKIADLSVATGKIQDGAVTTSKIADRSITAAKLTAIAAGGDLTGIFPVPSIAANAVTTSKILDGAVTTLKLADTSVTTSKIKDSSITLSKLAPGLALGGGSPSGAAGGDLSGTYPNPGVIKLRGTAISSALPAVGQVLKFDGTQWLPSKDSIGAFSLPFSSVSNSNSSLFSISNQGSGTSIEGINSIANTNSFAVSGRVSSINAGATSAGVRGINNGTGSGGYGIWGSHDGSGYGVYGTSASGSGVNGFSSGGFGVYASSSSGTGIFATSDNGLPANFDISNVGSFSDDIFASNAGYGNGITAIANYGYGVLGIANDPSGTGVLGINNSGGEAILGFTISDYASGIVGRNDGTYAAVRGFNTANNGVGVLAIANSGGATNGTALVAELEGADAGNTAEFKANGNNVARIDNTGKGFFNGGTQMGGADVAEFFDVEGDFKAYEPGDVLIISETSDRKVEKSTMPYSTLVVGVYATKPGVMLTEKNAEKDSLDNMVPMGVIGVVPTKVCLEGGAIQRGDLLVTSSVSGVAMKADSKKLQVGQVLGKALQGYNETGIGKINVLVSVK